jgi:RND superfamily putative drug exporter
MPESASSRQVADVLRENFGSGEQNALTVVMPAVTGDLSRYAAELSRQPNVGRVDGPTGSYSSGALVSPAGPTHARFRADNAAYLAVVPSTDDEQALDTLVEDTRAVPAPATAYVGGIAALGHDTTATLRDRLPVAAGVLAVAIIVLLFLLTGSVFVPLLAVVLSVLSLSATFGALVWIFQQGHLVDLLGGFVVTGSLASTVPVMLFCVAFGLAMDYQVFLLARIKEERDRGSDGVAAVAVGLEKVGRIVTAAAVLVSLVFLGFLVSDITFMKAFGVGLPLAVLVDATLIRGALLPAAMRLGGRATWWAPRPLRRLHARFGLHEGEVDPVRAT